MTWPHAAGDVTLRAQRDGDAAILVAGRDDEARRWLGEGHSDPRPTGIIEVGGEMAGWVDHDDERAWLAPGEVNVGYLVFPAFRRRGVATAAVGLLLDHLAEDSVVEVATLLIDPRNAGSLGVARRAGFEPRGDIDGQLLFARPVPRPG
jgi:RimJ/RimL family protein N-acetyltransferase